MPIEFDEKIFVPKFIPYMNSRKRYAIMYGSAGSGKSWAVAQKHIIRMLSTPGERFIFVRNTGKSIRDSQFKLTLDTINNWGLSKHFQYKVNEMEIYCPHTGSQILSKGLDDVEKLKSLASPTTIWIEEASETSYEDFDQLDLRLRGGCPNYFQITLSLNPVSKMNWIYKHFFLKPTPELLAETEIIHSTYKDNPFLDANYIKKMERLAITDPDRYQVYGLGEWGDIGNTVFKQFIEIPSSEYPKSFDDEYYGLDFGYNHPMALIWIGEKDGIKYIREVIYERELTKANLIKKMKDLGVNSSHNIYCDNAEPASIEELKIAGFSAIPAEKGGDSVKAQIDFVKSEYSYIRTCPENSNLKTEVTAYQWKKLPNGDYDDVPVPLYDDLLCALRYGLYTHSKQNVEIKMFFAS